MQSNSNHNTTHLNNTHPNVTHPNTTEQTLTQEEKMNIEIIKRIISEKKTTLPSLMIEDWKTVKAETEKINKLSTNIFSIIMELNDLIYSEAKLVSDYIGIN